MQAFREQRRGNLTEPAFQRTLDPRGIRSSDRDAEGGFTLAVDLLTEQKVSPKRAGNRTARRATRRSMKITSAEIGVEGASLAQ
jgi:hypothetical protein